MGRIKIGEAQYLGAGVVNSYVKVLLLGASGLLGHNVLRRLMADGHQVVALLRREGAVHLDGSWTTVVGSPTDPDVLAHAVEGCEAIINCIGQTDMSLRRHDYDGANVRVPELVVQTMKHHGIRRLVHVSTANTIGYGTQNHPTNESAEAMEPFASSYYAESKAAGEAVVLRAARENRDWHVVVINPGFMLGYMDVKPSSGRMLLSGYRRRVMLSPKGGKAYVHVADVADAVVNALERGRNGERYIAVNSAECHTIKYLYELQAQTMGYRQHVLLLPNWLLTIAGLFGNALRAFGVRTELSLNNVRQLMVQEYYDNSKAVSELGMPQTPLAQAIRDFHDWRLNKK